MVCYNIALRNATKLFLSSLAESDMCNEPLHKQSARKRFMCMRILNRNVIVAQRTVTKNRLFEA